MNVLAGMVRNNQKTQIAHKTAAGERKAQSSPRQFRQLFSSMWVECICNFHAYVEPRELNTSWTTCCDSSCSKISKIRFCGKLRFISAMLWIKYLNLSLACRKPGQHLLSLSASLSSLKIIHSPKVKVGGLLRSYEQPHCSHGFVTYEDIKLFLFPFF